MTPTEVIVNERTYRLGRRIGRGGEGIVHAIGDDSKYAVKLYTTHDITSKEAKIAAMVRAQLAGHAPLVAFPLAIARGVNGAFIGFVMPLVNDHKPLHDLYSPGSRKHHFPQADYRFLVRTAANFARAVASVHKSNCVIGDINHSGILVSPKAMVSLIDADSFQFFANGQSFLCRVGVPEYTPPELQGKPLAGVVRTSNHDAFGMAVVIFQLLFMGRHPFVGTVRRGDIPPLHDNIRNFRYVYTENCDVGMDQPPGTPSLSDFSPGIAALFDAAFLRETADRRPLAEQWVRQLEALEASLNQCQDNSLHYAPRDASECAWCEMERQLGTFLFLPYFPNADQRMPGFDPGASGFNIDLIWARIEAVGSPTPQQLTPRLNAAPTSPSANATNARKPDASNTTLGVAITAIAVIGLLASPKAFIIWVPLFIWGITLFKEKAATIDSAKFTRAFIEIEQLWTRELQNWYQRIGFNDFLALKQELIEAKDAFKALAKEEREQLNQSRANRRAMQLHAFLDGFDIQHAKIQGIGPAKQATLASYGIDTAADISRIKLLAVPGFGEATSRGLLEWRDKIERRFVYREQENDIDRQEIARIRSTIESKSAHIRRKLSVGAQNLEAAIKRVVANATKEDLLLSRINAQRDQVKCDLAYLGIPFPNVPSVAPLLGQSIPRPYQPATPTAPSSSSQKCPRCGSQMVKRLARRGRNSGNYFWGCSRYPSCKGTRNI